MEQAPCHRIFTREQVREVDRLAIERYGIPGLVLMENASRGLAKYALSMLPEGGRALIICGGGNNGGDGLAAARHLHNAGEQVAIVLLRPYDSYTGDARTNLDICRAMDLFMIEAADDVLEGLRAAPPADLLIDGVLGTGISIEVRPPMTDVIDWTNSQPAPVLAIDIPSGLDCDTGRPLGAAVRAAATVTFVGVKRGFLQPGADQYTGRIVVVDIGAPRELVERLGEEA
jgi:NAD(P)H-hydrate epimerase